MRISDWSSDVCSSDLQPPGGVAPEVDGVVVHEADDGGHAVLLSVLLVVSRYRRSPSYRAGRPVSSSTQSGLVHHARDRSPRSEEHTSELQSLMRISYAVFCLKQKTKE